jgi:hypothetical protein
MGDLTLNRFEYRRFIVALRDSLIKDVSCVDRTFTSTNWFYLLVR